MAVIANGRRYASDRDRLLHELVNGGYAIRHEGSTAVIHIYDRELAEVMTGAVDDRAADLVGSFVLTADAENVYVDQFDIPELADAAYDRALTHQPGWLRLTGDLPVVETEVRPTYVGRATVSESRAA